MDMNKKEKQYRITVSESQLRMIANCVEDIHRLMAGQTELQNCTSMLDLQYEVQEELKKIQPLVTPHIGLGSYYKWSGGNCPNEWQRKFIAESYYLYREIRHFDAVNRGVDNVYRSPTLTCADSGMPIVIEEVGEEKG